MKTEHEIISELKELEKELQRKLKNIQSAISIIGMACDVASAPKRTHIVKRDKITKELVHFPVITHDIPQFTPDVAEVPHEISHPINDHDQNDGQVVNCLYCGIPFHKKRKDQTCCCSECRSNLNKKKLIPPPSRTTIFKEC